MEAIPDAEFKTLVRQYVAFLDSIMITQKDKSVTRFEHAKQVFAQLDRVFFPGGLTFPTQKQAVTQIHGKQGGGRISPPVESEPAAIDGLSAKPPAINIRELHRRKLCVACRHYLRGMCYRGDTCNFCHNPEHQAEHEAAVTQIN
jgi:hypothetical protein